MKIELTQHRSDSFGTEFDRFVGWLSEQGHDVSVTTESNHYVSGVDESETETTIEQLFDEYCRS